MRKYLLMVIVLFLRTPVTSAQETALFHGMKWKMNIAEITVKERFKLYTELPYWRVYEGEVVNSDARVFYGLDLKQKLQQIAVFFLIENLSSEETVKKFYEVKNSVCQNYGAPDTVIESYIDGSRLKPDMSIMIKGYEWSKGNIVLESRWVLKGTKIVLKLLKRELLLHYGDTDKIDIFLPNDLPMEEDKL